MKKILLVLLAFLTTINMSSQEKNPIVLIGTSCGNIKLKLYNETPLHRDNFVKLIESGFYENLLFHRVIKNFMIQGGDPQSRDASDEAVLDYMVESEFRTPEIFHRKGVLAAARTGDDVNPQRASSASQFYIVVGEVFSEQKLHEQEKTRFVKLEAEILKRLQAESSDKTKELYKTGDKEALAQFREQLQNEAQVEAETRKAEVMYTQDQKDVYTTIGGVPRLDGAYTVFGEVIEGMDVVEKIQEVETNRNDRPLQNVRMNLTVLER